jgi:uncharacterized protein YyaL (SSP411 family)
VLLRLKEEYDGAEPSASSVAVMNLLALSHLTGDASMVEKVESTLQMFGGNASTRGRSVPMMLAALSTYHAGIPQVVIVGEPGESGARLLTDVVRRTYLPHAVVVPVREPHREALAGLLPWTKGLRMREGRATAYVCREFACKAPTTSPDELARQLQDLR